jgi:hypothetical protein
MVQKCWSWYGDGDYDTRTMIIMLRWWLSWYGDDDTAIIITLCNDDNGTEMLML